MKTKNEASVVGLRPGRPRSDQAYGRILQTAMTVIREVGVARMSLDEVAARAGVSKPTIYRRWSGKIHLAVAAIVEACRPQGLPASGRPLQDIVELLSYFRTHFEAQLQLPTLGSLLQECNQPPGLLAAFRDFLRSADFAPTSSSWWIRHNATIWCAAAVQPRLLSRC